MWLLNISVTIEWKCTVKGLPPTGLHYS